MSSLRIVPLVLLVTAPAFAGGGAGTASSFDDLRVDGLARLRLADPAGAEASLAAAVDRPSVAPAEIAKARLLLARARAALGRPADALAVLGAVDPAAVPAVLKDLFALERARALERAADPGARAAFQAFLADHPASRHGSEARLALARLALAAGDRAAAARSAQEVLDARPPRGERSEAMLLYGRASDEPARGAMLRRLFVELPDTLAAAAAGVTEADLAPAERKERAAAFFEAMDYEEAQRLREALWAEGDRSPGLARDLAQSHLLHVRDDPRRALELVDLAERGGAFGREEALFFRARAHARLEEYDRALALYRKALDDGAKGDRKVQALYYLGWLPYDRDQLSKALPAFDRFLKEVRAHDLRSYVLWAKGWSLFRLKRYKEALKVFDAMEKLGNCLVAGKAQYWGGHAWRALGDDRKAVASMRRVIDRYPLTWYAVLAAQRLKAWHGTPLPAWMTGPAVGLPEPAPLWPFDRLPADLAARLREVKDLSDVGEHERARALYEGIAKPVEKAVPDPAERARFLLTVYDAVEDYHALYARAQADFGRRMGAVPTKASALYWMVAYPRAHRSLARVLQDRFGLPEHWVYAIMRQESRYRPAQVSYTAALGIMQMIPKTAKVISKALGVPFQVETFFEPGNNLLFCTYYLAALLRDFKGQIAFASAAYNTGAPGIKRFLREHRGHPLDSMVEHIAYNEGRNYCRKVAEHLVRYAWLHLPAAERRTLYARLFPDPVDYDLGTAVEY